MADTDENKEGVEPEEKEQAAPAKKVAKKKAAKKKAAKKKVAKKKVAKKKAAAKKAPEKAEAPEESVSVEEKPEEKPEAPAAASVEPVVPQTQGVAVDAEQEKNQLIGLWIVIAVVCVMLIGALSPSGEKPGKAHAPAASHETPKPKVQLQEASPTPQATASADKAPEHVADEKGATTPAEGDRPPKRPEGSPPGYWQFEGGAWHYVPFAQETAPAQAAEAPVAPAPQQDKGPPETPADAPPGYWKYESGQWKYEPYHQGQAKPAPSNEKLTSS